MSQDEEDATKFELNNKNYQYNNNKNNGDTKRTGMPNQHVMPLYENFTIKHKNKAIANDHSTAERAPNKSEAFNYEYRFDRNTTDLKFKASDNDGITLSDDYEEYENINFLGEKQFNKKIILQKYFRSALVGPRTNIYENLCRGCNYGVFNARGPLCTFCECIVNGVNSIKSDSDNTADLESSSTSNNIYENICEYCGLIYSGVSDKECKCQLENYKKKVLEEKLGSEELLITKEEKKIKLSKSKSFNKSSKPKLFSNFWDTLRKPKSTTTVHTKKPLEIIHHVEGYEQVFHTKDTFDLKKICELKRNGTSCSDQHIYGRLKQHDLVTSLEEFNSTQSLTQNATFNLKVQNKKPRISKPKFLRTQSTQPPVTNEANITQNNFKISTTSPQVSKKRFLYLNDSVCQWMTSLRREVITYNTNCDDITDTLCYPKSIPSKNVLIYCKAPVTNNINNTLQNLKEILYNDYICDLTEIVTLRRHNSMTSWDSLEVEETEKQEQQIIPSDCYQLMVEEFITNIINRQMLNMKAKDKHLDNLKVMAGVNNNDSHNNNNIPLRQATTTATNNNNNRHKRQGMYLRLEDHPPQQQILDGNLQNCNTTNGKEFNREIENNTESNDIEYENLLYSSSLKKDHNCNTAKQTPVIEELYTVSSSLKQSKKGWDLIKPDKRQGIHEHNILEAFEELLRTEQKLPYFITNDKEYLELQINKNESQVKEILKKESDQELPTFGVNNPISLHFPIQILNVAQLINQQQLSTSLNTTIICYDNYLIVFLRYISPTNKESNKQQLYKLTNKQLVRKFHKFYNYCQQTIATTKPVKTTRVLLNVSTNLKLDLNKANGYSMKEITEKTNESVEKPSANGLKDSHNDKNTSVLNKTEIKVKTPPQVPKRDPKTKLSPTTENKPILENSLQHSEKLTKMTKPSSNLMKETYCNNQQKDEESIYQPIWKFKTKGEVPERYHTDDDYYDIKQLKEKLQQDTQNSETPKISVTDDTYPEEEEDHNNWEPDEEFVFAKQIKKHRSSSLTSDQISTIRSSHSSNSSIGTSSSLSGSTITEFASSTATLASTVSSSLMHHLFRNIGIFYSLTEPKLRAIIYDYDRVHSSSYFAKNITNFHINDSGIGKSLSPFKPLKQRKSPNTPSPVSSVTSSPITLKKRDNLCTSSTSLIASESDNISIIPPQAKVFTTTSSSTNSVKTASPIPQLISNSVQAWKYQLLDVNYMEDEEDMVVSESEILRAQKIKEDIQLPLPAQPQVLQRLQRFKSLSTENILDIPNEDDKKTIAERIANMYTRFSPIQRGILNINGRNSPKSEKKAYKSNRSSQTTSLYLEDGLKPKYPIFGAPLEQLELQQNVPRFVVDAVDYIERKDRIIQDGLYRACGNKFSIDELKQKLTKSYIYDSKLIVADDIHTITSLLKQFFRDLAAHLIPKEIYSRITSNLADKQGTEAIRIAIEEMREPNKSTLRFLIKHLTNVAVCSSSNRMNASNLAIVWGPSLFAQNDTYDMIGRMNTLTKVLIENYDRIFDTNERLL